jgi:hypothetical protein
MNNIFEKDWAEENWGGFSGMSIDSDWCIVDKSKKFGKPDSTDKNAPGETTSIV